MIKGKLKVFNVGTQWFIGEMEEQGIDVLQVRWSPPAEVPQDINRILEKLGAGR